MVQRQYLFAACLFLMGASVQAQTLWQVELRHDQQSIHIESIVPIDNHGVAPAARTASNHATTQLQLLGVHGEMLFKTNIPDPRVIRAPFALDGQQGHAYAFAEPDTLTIWVPAHPSAAQLGVLAPEDPLQPFQTQAQLVDVMSVRGLAARLPANNTPIAK
jgi:hypothetical protein